jgi:hypothetical protein
VHGFGGDPVSTWKYFQLFIDDAATPTSDWWRTADLFFYSYASRRLSIAEHAQMLLDFFDSIFPTVDPEVFQQTSPQMMQICSDLKLPTEPLDNIGTRNYSELYLVGHSMGGVLIREAILDRAAKAAAHAVQPREAEMLNANLRLFAPAMLGAQPSGFLGVLVQSLRSIPLFSRLIEPIAKTNTVVRQLQPESKKLAQIREGTERLARIGSYPALIAHVLFGEHEQVVERDKFELDELEVPAVGHDHWSICKPSKSYLLPIDFVVKGRHRARYQTVG